MTEITINTPKVIQLDVEAYAFYALDCMLDKIENDFNINLEYIMKEDKETFRHDFIAEFTTQLSQIF